MMLWKCPSFSFEKNKSGIHTRFASVNVRYFKRPTGESFRLYLKRLYFKEHTYPVYHRTWDVHPSTALGMLAGHCTPARRHLLLLLLVVFVVERTRVENNFVSKGSRRFAQGSISFQCNFKCNSMRTTMQISLCQIMGGILFESWFQGFLFLFFFIFVNSLLIQFRFCGSDWGLFNWMACKQPLQGGGSTLALQLKNLLVVRYW